MTKYRVYGGQGRHVPTAQRIFSTQCKKDKNKNKIHGTIKKNQIQITTRDIKEILLTSN